MGYQEHILGNICTINYGLFSYYAYNIVNVRIDIEIYSGQWSWRYYITYEGHN